MITGNEQVNPFFEYNENGYGQTVTITFADGSKQFLPYQSGENLYQRVLREFMCALLSNGLVDLSPHELAKNADEYATAYISQLNKHQS